MRIQSINNFNNGVYVQSDIKKRKENISNLNFKSEITKPAKSTLSSPLKKIYQSCKKFSKECVILAGAALLALVFSKQYSDSQKELGYVEPLQETFETKKEAMDYAISRIVNPLNLKDAYEYSVLLDYNTYSPISERKGDSTSVGNYPLSFAIKDFLKIKHPYIALHGHPEELFMNNRLATQTFSFQDFKNLNNDENRMETYVVKKDGRFCVLRKKEGFKQIPEKELVKLEEKFNEAFWYSWANPIDVYKNDTIIHTFYDYQGMHNFWKGIADNYNLEYYTNYGVHDGVDVYLDYYYPELLQPQGPTSHREFKL